MQGADDQTGWKERVVEEWRAGVPWWLRWGAQVTSLTRPFTEALVRMADLRPESLVLDLACGLGDPALTLADAAPLGRVTAVDITPEMVHEARSRARAGGVTNVEFVEADLESLPFPPESFDRVTCRFGIVYAADARRALGEIGRVLRPGGVVVLLVWGPLALNEYWSVGLDALARRVHDLPAEVAQPVEFTFADGGGLTALLREAGFAEAGEHLLTPAVTWAGPPEELVAMTVEDYAEQLAGLTGAERQAVQREMGEEYARRVEGDGVGLRSAVIVAWGRRAR